VSEQRKELRPWNVRPGDRMHGLEVFPFRTPDGSGRSSGTVESVVRDRSWITRESCWLVMVTLDSNGETIRAGAFYSDERVEVWR